MTRAALGLEPDATEAEIKTRYRQLAMKAHPDRGGTAADFQKLQEDFNSALDEVGGTTKHFSLFPAREPCMACDGRGFTILGGENSFIGMRMNCQECGGLGFVKK